MPNDAHITPTAANCQSTRLGYRLSFVNEAVQPESLWVCERDGDRRAATDSECERCARWQPSEETVAPRPVAGVFTGPTWQP